MLKRPNFEKIKQDLVTVNNDNQVVTDSLKVAEFFGKYHHHVIRDIEGLVDRGVTNFGDTPYTNPQNGQTYRKYTMDRDGFTFLVMGFNGERAFEFKKQYIAAFNLFAENGRGRQRLRI